MDEQNAIKELQDEMQQLSKELKMTQAKLEVLHSRLLQLQGKEAGPNTLFVPDTSARSDEPVSFENFIGLRLIHVVGIIVLVIGLSIGVKYAIDQQLISELARVSLAYAAGVLLYLLSWQLKKQYTTFSAILFSGAMASIYFTTYAAFVYYHFFSFLTAFVLMILLTVFTVYKALEYNRLEIAVMGLVGAYAIPFLISNNADRADLFFAYITLINSAVVFLSFKKGWKLVGYLAQVVTWVLLIGWAMSRYEASQRWIGVVFMSVFFVLFMLNALSNKIRQGQMFTLREMQQVVLNNIVLYITALILYAPLYSSADIGLVSILFCLFTGIQAAAIFYFFPEEAYTKKMLALLALFLLLVYIANQWDGITVTLMWLAVAVLLFIWGAAGKAVWLRMSAMVLMGVTLLKLVLFDSVRFTTIQKIIAYITLGILLLVVGFFYQKFKENLFSKE